jgi:hypothetical protein
MATIEVLLSDKINTINDNLLSFFEKHISKINHNGFYIDLMIVDNKKTTDELKKSGVKSLPALKYSPIRSDTVFKQGYEDIIDYIKNLCTKTTDKKTKSSVDEQMQEFIKQEMNMKEEEEEEDENEDNMRKSIEKKMSEFNKRRENRIDPKEEVKPGQKKSHELNTIKNTKGPNRTNFKAEPTENKEDKEILDKIGVAANSDGEDDFDMDEDDMMLMSKG